MKNRIIQKNFLPKLIMNTNKLGKNNIPQIKDKKHPQIWNNNIPHIMC